MMKTVRTPGRLALTAAFIGMLAGPAGAETVYIKAARLLDVESGKYVADPLLTVTDGKIAAVESGKSAPAGGTLVDLGEDTILPGLIDMHVHLDGRPEYGGYNSLQFTDSFWTVLGVANAKKMLEAGFTSVRDVGDQNYDAEGLREAISEGWVPGPAHHHRQLRARRHRRALRRDRPAPEHGAQDALGRRQPRPVPSAGARNEEIRRGRDQDLRPPAGCSRTATRRASSR